MSAKKDQDEPTMEEILASIRRIISEEGEPEPAPEPQPREVPVRAAEPAPLTVPKPAPEPVFELEPEDDVLELTDVVEEEAVVADDFSFDDLVSEMAEQNDEISLDDEFEPEFTAPEPEPVVVPVAAPVVAAAQPTEREYDSVDPADESDAIMSDLGADSVRTSFGQLSDLLVAGYAGADKTLEGMVREMLKPMLKTWLDQNLPDIVERTVAREIARLARVKKP